MQDGKFAKAVALLASLESVNDDLPAARCLSSYWLVKAALAERYFHLLPAQIVELYDQVCEALPPAASGI